MSHQLRLSFSPYRSVLRASLEETLAGHGLAATAEDHATLLSVLGRIEPHAEVPAALDRLRARFRLAIISNTADALIASTVVAISTPIDFVVPAEQAQAYKPDHQLFLHAYTVMGVSKDDKVHVGMGQFTDLKVCHELGIRSVWIDWLGEPAKPRLVTRRRAARPVGPAGATYFGLMARPGYCLFIRRCTTLPTTAVPINGAAWTIVRLTLPPRAARHHSV